MSVYIDNIDHPYGRMIMNHMVADSQEELILMAEKIGVNRKWIQDKGTNREHFDVCLSAKKKAISLGAIEIDMRELAEMTRNRKDNRELTRTREPEDPKDNIDWDLFREELFAPDRNP